MDLLDKLNSKKQGSQSTVDGSTQVASSQHARGDVNVNTDPIPTGDNLNSYQGELDRGADLISRSGTKQPASKIAATRLDENNVSEVEDEPSSAGKIESSGVNNPDSWSLDSAFKEIKKLREENKQYRIQRSEELSKMREEMQTKVKQREDELEKAKQAEKELAKIKEEQVDKKRSLEERLADREARLATYEARVKEVQDAYERRLSEQSERLGDYETQIKAQEQVYKERLDVELARIPEKYKSHAQLIVDGAKLKGDARDALFALNEAVMSGMFEDRTVVVNHSVPNAHNGARASKERLDEAAKEQRGRMSSQQKIKNALSEIRSGVPNSAYRPK